MKASLLKALFLSSALSMSAISMAQEKGMGAISNSTQDMSLSEAFQDFMNKMSQNSIIESTKNSEIKDSSKSASIACLKASGLNVKFPRSISISCLTATIFLSKNSFSSCFSSLLKDISESHLLPAEILLSDCLKDSDFECFESLFVSELLELC